MNDVDIRADDDRRVTVVAVLDVPPEGVQPFGRYESRVLPLPEAMRSSTWRHVPPVEPVPGR